MYEEMKKRIETTAKLGQISEAKRKEHKGFHEWDLVSNQRDHQAIVQILINGKDSEAVDSEGQPLPTLVYLSREKRPQYHHNFKAGAMNALIRVSSRISNGSIILNVDCDMYSNNSESVRDALCFLMDEEKGHEIAYVQYPQNFNNLTKNDIYGTSFRVIHKISSPWVLPFVYLVIVACGYSFGEFLWCGGTIQGWWNEQRIWMFKRTTSYLFGFFATILKQLGLAKTAFVVTAKVADEDVSQRYEQEVMEFGAPSPMFTILATLAMLNLFSLAGVLKRVIMGMQTKVLGPFTLQIALCLLLVFINLPVYQGLFFRKDKGSMPTSVIYQSITIAMVACSMALY
ncbi:hypothetical protein L1049_009969 [Liquidambar formosana]|uniref:Uncharacterized protein n=1 Tax=Liquidambar formosana TaxID=63359 RepID=A0AAP0R6M1_LIQFO